MDKAKVRLTKELEKSINTFEKTSNARKLRMAIKNGIALEDFVVLKTLGTFETFES